MQGEINGLKMLIRQESRSTHSIHCFAHQLQLTLVGVSKMCVEVGKLVVLVSNILNVLGSSFKCMDKLRDFQKATIQEALDMNELTTDARSMDERVKATGHLKCCRTFEVAFILHLMRDVFRLVKLDLLLPVVTVSVERNFSAMKFIKNDLQSQMSDVQPILLYLANVLQVKKRLSIFFLKTECPSMTSSRSPGMDQTFSIYSKTKNRKERKGAKLCT
ncbi:hypothetical protein H5410_050639 [Solanum commersonii]|uniref:HAT C-terminal dimerisation domain-containing protein n=1 Tax=Solanum commersonii TaxID=4109 RepID=A0A9J5WY70_SOLCO|nr:hypothetical protein H5410_050639 [Solanum commersonii]